MKTLSKPFVLAAICLLGIAIIRFSNAADAKAEKNTALNKRIEVLESRLATAESRLAKLEANQILPSVITGPSIEHHGKIWKEGEVNGWPYYLIPLGGTEGASGR